MKLKYLFICLASVITFSVNAQRDYIESADKDFKNESYFEASQKYMKSISKLKKRQDKSRAYFFAGECQRLMLNHVEAEKYFLKAIDLGYDDFDPIVFKNYAEMKRQQGEYKDAIPQFEKYLAIRSTDAEAKLWKESCEQSILMIENPTRHVVENESQINTEYYDFSPSFFDKRNNSLVFSSSRPASTGSEIDPRTGETFMDLFTTDRDNNDNWSQPKPLPEGINSDDNEGATTLDRNATTMYFTRCPREDKFNAGCDILMVEKQGSNWKKPESLLKQDGQDTINHGHPTLTTDGNTIIFASDMPGGKGGKDLWMISYNKREKSWSAPVNLGASINTSGDEMFPFIDKDGNLYFSSNGYPGMGGLDLYVAKAVDAKKWSDVQNLGFPMNSSADDFGIIFENAKYEKGFFTSNRDGGKGKDDIYNFQLPPIEFTLECVIKNKKTNDPISGAKLKLIGSDGSMVEVVTNANGVFSFGEIGDKRYLLPDNNYTLEASKDEFLKDITKLTTVGYTESKKFYQEFFIQPTDVVIDFPEVQYSLGKWDLQVIEGQINSKDSLDYLFHTLIMNPTIIVDLQSHTDCRGSDAANQTLSQKRAESCVNYLIEKGIPKERLQATGKGESDPRYEYTTCDEINKQKKNKEEFERLHQMNRRTQFKVLTFDYKPTNNYGVADDKVESTEAFVEAFKGVK